jgi:hypothetical protein
LRLRREPPEGGRERLFNPVAVGPKEIDLGRGASSSSSFGGRERLFNPVALEPKEIDLGRGASSFAKGAFADVEVEPNNLNAFDFFEMFILAGSA